MRSAMARPVEFDRDKVLQQAMLQFWRLGYHKTSVRDLTGATQLKPGSLYGAFNKMYCVAATECGTAPAVSHIQRLNDQDHIVSGGSLITARSMSLRDTRLIIRRLR